ncbi:LPS-assembly protein LptD [Treponema pedis]|uniref:LPS-assembly protein LptD n=1 Tax=Treponema pedis TaxID=409322 RepID=A0A7S7AVN0_9SPIR|nr:LPS-assembly protein LptD [Treponema pedis]QOW59721.1 LPS-assembly protein LptD [Treponema pedis]
MKKRIYIFASLIILFSSSVYPEGQKIIINSAQYTEYKKVLSSPLTEEPDKKNKPEKKELEEADSDNNKKDEDKKNSEPLKDELVIFTGSVSISVSDGSSTSTINADKIIHNKTRETLTAFGNVFYERKIGSSSGESFKGEYLLFNIKKLEGVFLDGILEQAETKKGKDPFRIHTEVAGKNESGAIAFKDALLTTSKDDEPLWSIRASRIWLLPGNEMAFANGFLSVGIVPVLYLPFFYYPADEMLFHPVFGYKNRQGAFIQTTTYLLGRKPLPKAEDGSSFSNFMQSDSLKKQKLEGLFFKNLDEPADEEGGSHLKILADKYSNLGFMLGLDGKFMPKKGYVKEINFHYLFGFSNTIYPAEFSGLSTLVTGPNTDTVKFSRFDSNGKINKNKAKLFGLTVPFRYDFEFGMSMTKEPFNLSLSMPLLSDPYFRSDFMNRSEDMNWFKYLLDKDKLAEAKDADTVHGFSWKLDSSLRPSFAILQPFINSIAIDAASGRFNFESKTDSTLIGKEKSYSPERTFFYPKNFVPELRMGMSGSIFSTSMLKNRIRRSKETDLTGIKNPFDDNFGNTLKSEIENGGGSGGVENKGETENTVNKSEESAESGKEIEEPPLFVETVFPPFHLEPVKTYNELDFISYDLNYKLSGLFQKDITFDHKSWNKLFDINWKEFYSKYYKLNGTASVESKFSYNMGLLDISNSFELQGNYQKHFWVKDKGLLKDLELNNYKLNVYSLKNSNSFKVRPFVFNSVFKPVYFEWAITEILIQNKFTGTYDKPAWKEEKAKWEKEYITKHAATIGTGFTLNEYTQLVTSSIDLPPLLRAYSFAGNFNFPYTALNVSSKLFEKDIEKEKKGKSPKEIAKLKKWNWEPFKVELKFSFPYDIFVSQSYVYNIEDKKHDVYAVSLGWKYISASYNMRREIPYKLDTLNGWIEKSKEKEFIPYSLNFNFSNSSSPLEFYSWKNRIRLQLSASSSLSFNLIRITDSYFTFSPKITFKIHEFLDFSFSSTSRNEAIAKYFQDAMNLPIVIPGEKNVIKDLAESFYFWDEKARRRSAFKLKSLDFELTHYLKDWIMKFSYSVKPVKRPEDKNYKMIPTVSFVVQWKPIGDIKVQAKKENNKFTVDRGEIK